MIKLEQLTLPIKFNDNDIIKAIISKIDIKNEDIKSFEILKLSIDARKKPKIKYIASVIVELKNNLERKFSAYSYQKFDKKLEYEKIQSNKKVLVVGFGPSGMFSALALARMGLKPIIIEQGKMVNEREQDINEFWQNRKINKYSNVQFGEGGAGTFSDGKLNSNVENDYCKIVLRELYNHGAPKEITYLNKPHIGSDNLKQVVKNIREEIKSLGGEFYFLTK